MADEPDNKIAFEPKSPYTRVSTSVQAIDHDVVIEAGTPFETSDPHILAALDDHPHVKRVGQGAPSDKRAPEEHATAATRRRAAREGRADESQPKGGKAE